MLGAGAWLRKKMFVWIVAPDGAMDVVCYCPSSSKLGTDIINHHPGDKISSTIQSNYKIAPSQLCTKLQPHGSGCIKWNQSGTDGGDMAYGMEMAPFSRGSGAFFREFC